MPITIPYPSEQIHPFVAYLVLALDCNVSVVNAVVWHSRLIFPCRIVDRILRFADPACKTRVLRIDSRGLWGLQRLAMVEAAVRLVADGVFAADRIFLLTQLREDVMGLSEDVATMGRKFYLPRAASVRDFVFIRRDLVQTYGQVESQTEIAMVDDCLTCEGVENLKNVVHKTVLCNSRAYYLDEPLHMEEE